MRPHISTVPTDRIKAALGEKSVAAIRVILAARNGTFRGNCAERVLSISRLYLERFITLHAYVDMGCCTYAEECDFIRGLEHRLATDKKRIKRRLAKEGSTSRTEGED